MNRLALLPISTSDDGKLCGEYCPFGQTNGCFLRGAKWGGGGWIASEHRQCGPEDFKKPPTWRRTEACLSATSQADRLVAVRDAAVHWAEGPPDDRQGEHALAVAVKRALESTRAETEGK